MIVEHAILDVDPAEAAAYERALQQALPLIAATPGLIHLTIRPCLARKGRYRGQGVTKPALSIGPKSGHHFWKNPMLKLLATINVFAFA